MEDSPAIQEEQWPPVDALIFAGERLHALIKIREITGCTLSEALTLLYERFNKLSIESPTRFKGSLPEYWKDFYS